MILSSAQNPKIKLVKRLRGKRAREQTGRFVIDYERDLRRALDCGYQLDFALHCPELGDLGLPDECELIRITPQLMTRLSYRENPGGVVAVMRSKSRRGLADLQDRPVARALALVNLRVPGNIGALLRTADAAGIDAIVLVDTALDLYNPNIIRSSTGACFLDNIYWLSGAEARAWFKRAGFQVVCADVAGDASLYAMAFAAKTAIVLGAEDSGLDSAWLDSCDLRLRIPMVGALKDSLNVSVSGAIMMYELHRQMQIKQAG